ncbi:urea ABC transporter permease subunit UrtC, partial [Escherichia coli]|nr:urea ABC transporter permease subunit UrtC [Escherichia coli]
GEMSPGNSIEMAVWVAVGGRGTLIGPIIGAFLVNGAKTLLTAWVPEYWLFVLGAIFVLVTLYLPNGVLGLMSKLRMKKRAPAQAKAHEAATVTGDHA